MGSGVWKVKAKGKGLNPFFLLGSPQDARQPGKKKKVGGVSGGRRQGAHYACWEVEEGERGDRERSPASLGNDARIGEEEGDRMWTRCWKRSDKGQEPTEDGTTWKYTHDELGGK